jgi:hypothetical protein
MKIHPILKKILAALSLTVLTLAAYLLWARPYQLHWGATSEEIARAMPGDELISNPLFLATRAITINGTPEQIWPWLVQIGYGRAGFYGYDIIENAGSPRGIHSAESILPEFQNFKVGDPVPISSVAGMQFYAIQPDQYLIWQGIEKVSKGGFTWALYPLDASHTRLVSRIRWSHHLSQPGLLALDLFTEFTDHIAVREVLQGVKGRVEGYSKPFVQQNIEFAIYVSAVLLFLAALVLLLVRPLSWRGWLAGLAAGIIWLAVWYAPLSVWIGLVLELFLLAALVRAFRRIPTAQPAAEPPAEPPV